MRLQRAAVIVALLCAGCAPSLSVPPLNPTPTGDRHEGRVVWHDLYTTDAASAIDFYGQLLGWEFDDVIEGERGDYWVARHNGRPIAGVIQADPEVAAAEARASQWLTYLSSDELEGRETGRPGYKKAADFIAARFEEWGLKPVGDDGTYFQEVTLYRLRRSGQKAAITVGRIITLSGTFSVSGLASGSRSICRTMS